MLRVVVNITKTNFSLVCGNWSHLNSKVPNIKNCNNGNSTNDVKLKIKERDIKKKLKTCKTAVGTCKRYEDQTIQFIVNCLTSSKPTTNTTARLLCLAGTPLLTQPEAHGHLAPVRG